MKRIVSIWVLLLFLSGTVTAQRNIYLLRERQPSITGWERMQLQRDYFRIKAVQRQAERDGQISISERRQIRRLKQKARRDAIRYRYNMRGRQI